MILCDTSIVVALVNKRDNDHARCVEITKSVRERMVTTWPCLTEVLYLVGAHHAQEEVWRMIERKFLHISMPLDSDLERTRALMGQYADIPMDFADASLVVLAETLNVSKVLTLDGHFHAYRMYGKTPFEVLP